MTQNGQDEYGSDANMGDGGGIGSTGGLGGADEMLQPFDVRDQTSKRGMVWLIGGFIFLLLAAFIVLKLFSTGTRDRDQAPRIHANNSPYKEVPLERGGVQTPNQDKEIYQKLNGEGGHADPVTTVPVSEQPLEKPKMQSSQGFNGNRANVKIKEAVDQNQRIVNTPIPKTTAGTVVKNVVGSKMSQAGIASAYVVQVASLRSADEARGLWRKLQINQKSIIRASHFSDIKRVDLGDKGIYYRLRISGLASKTAANDLCTRLKANKQSCLVTKK